ncbi:universal stress protein [Salinispora tropica]|uniref:UspA domain protein n=1 Tax=Salinispora tropica (strain ATCC BAA-916 / DSM 44818 / JCM 13857 / NBRC 105044 / CNB-440) TaxID=369723 RepID=A4X597_SALTO|nr:universal stress protein [Salinispora tropica]ABP54047.1 UspA domain protein [Salinispora tropica CNB-440]
MNGTEILVGYDGSQDAVRAQEWAMDEAARSGRSVHLAYVFEWLTMAGWTGPGGGPSIWPDETARRQAEELVRQAAADATSPELTVTGELYEGPPALVLQERSARASLLVLGTRGLGGFAGLLVGSTAGSVAAHAHCPVVVVRGDADRRGRAGHVTTGVDGSEESLLALGFAVEQAAARKVPLHVLRVWRPPPGQRPPSAPDARAASQADRAELEESLSPWRRAFPDVPITVEVAEGNPAELLVTASRHAQLVVVGSRGRGGLAGMLLGSVSQQLLHHAHSPVAVVRER